MCGKVLCVYAASGFLYDVREIEEARNVGLTCYADFAKGGVRFQ